MVGISLFFGDAMITPAISVLSAVEGLSLITPAFEPYVVPLTLAIIAGLFLVQRWGTGTVSAFFGPITAVWFVAMGGARASGTSATTRRSCGRFNPGYAAGYLLANGTGRR